MPTVAEQLCLLRADSEKLVRPALLGFITELRCAMGDDPDDPIQCRCPEGREYFEKVGHPSRNPWAPSPDLWPLPRRDGGDYVPDNVRLTHFKCNSAASAYVNNETNRAKGFPNLRAAAAKGRETQRANGFPALRAGLETNRAKGFPNLQAGRANARTSALRQGLRWRFLNHKPAPRPFGFQLPPHR